MTLSPALAIALVLVMLVLVIVTVASLGAWYGIYLQLQEERARVLRGGWSCDECGRSMRYVGDTIDA